MNSKEIKKIKIFLLLFIKKNILGMEMFINIRHIWKKIKEILVKYNYFKLKKRILEIYLNPYHIEYFIGKYKLYQLFNLTINKILHF